MIEEIKRDLKTLLSEYRYNHSLRVAEVAKDLAKHYKINEEEAYLAGLTHDIAKEFTMEENEQFIKEHNLDENLLDPKNKKFIHGIVGAILVREKYHFNKSKLAYENGYRCIHIWDWDDKQKVINLLIHFIMIRI